MAIVVLHTLRCLPPDLQKALKDHNRAIELSPMDATMYNARGVVYSRMSPPEYSKAFKDYDRAIELNPDYYMAYSNRGNAYIEMSSHQHQKSIARLQPGHRISPE